MQDFGDELASVKCRFDQACAYLNFNLLQEQKHQLEEQILRPDLWDDPDRARTLTTNYGRVNDDLGFLESLRQKIEEAELLFELAKQESDDSVEDEIQRLLEALKKDFDYLDQRSLFIGEYDEMDAVCEIHAGSGGTDAQDWAEMLLRMYLRWAERHGFEVELDEISPGQEAGILSATFIIKGRYAYGLLLGEQGVQKLIRISPYGANRRETSHASFSAVPFFEDVAGEIDIDEKDLRIDTYRSSGAGGQHVNVTDSAVRITHLPTGIVVSCQNERSQHQNKARAMQILASKLLERLHQERKEEINAIAGPQSQVTRGNHFRTYTLAPYQLVKDDRTKFETGNVDSVLDGDIDPFIDSFLKWRRSMATSSEVGS